MSHFNKWLESNRNTRNKILWWLSVVFFMKTTKLLNWHHDLFIFYNYWNCNSYVFSFLTCTDSIVLWIKYFLAKKTFTLLFIQKKVNIRFQLINILDMLKFGRQLPLLSCSVAHPSSSSTFLLFFFFNVCVFVFEGLIYTEEKGCCSTNIPWNWILAEKWTLFHKWYLDPMAGSV